METGMTWPARSAFKIYSTVGAWGQDITDKLARASAALVLCGWMFNSVLAQSADEQDKTTAQTPEPQASRTAPWVGEYVIAGYGGVPYTHPSDVKFSKPGATDLTVHGVRWIGLPFKSPVFYGIRTIGWSAGDTFGAMLDFTHSKAISMRSQEVTFSGVRNSQPMPERARIGDTFRHFEFSHGHNTLIANGLVRLASLLPGLAPYIGGGVGVALPHTEVQFLADSARTYEYQYVGPAAQALIGLELRIPRVSVFLEYKFTIARYNAPLTNRDGAWFPSDFWRQFLGFVRGEVPVGGLLSTTLASHQVISGAGLRFTAALPDARR
jgi:lipid A oxidase